MVDAASIERVAIAEDGRQLRNLLQGPPRQQGGPPPTGFSRGLREGYAWREALHLKKQGRGTEAVPCAQGEARRARGFVRVPVAHNSSTDESTVSGTDAAAPSDEASRPDVEAQAALEEELRQEWGAEERLLQQKKEADAAARRQLEDTAAACAAARAAEAAAAERLRVRQRSRDTCLRETQRRSRLAAYYALAQQQAHELLSLQLSLCLFFCACQSISL